MGNPECDVEFDASKSKYATSTSLFITFCRFNLFLGLTNLSLCIKKMGYKYSDVLGWEVFFWLLLSKYFLSLHFWECL